MFQELRSWAWTRYSLNSLQELSRFKCVPINSGKHHILCCSKASNNWTDALCTQRLYFLCFKFDNRLLIASIPFADLIWCIMKRWFMQHTAGRSCTFACLMCAFFWFIQTLYICKYSWNAQNYSLTVGFVHILRDCTAKRLEYGTWKFAGSFHCYNSAQFWRICLSMALTMIANTNKTA